MKYDNNNIATIEMDFWVLSNNSGSVFLGGHNNTINYVDANNKIAAGGYNSTQFFSEPNKSMEMNRDKGINGSMKKEY